MKRLPEFLASCLVASLVHGQSAGYRDTSFPNTTGKGSAALDARVYYPAITAGLNQTMIAPPAEGYPVVVFLHEIALSGNDYPALATALAENGFVVVLSNTARFTINTQIADGAALYPGPWWRPTHRAATSSTTPSTWGVARSSGTPWVAAARSRCWRPTPVTGRDLLRPGVLECGT